MPAGPRGGTQAVDASVFQVDGDLRLERHGGELLAVNCEPLSVSKVSNLPCRASAASNESG